MLVTTQIKENAVSLQGHGIAHDEEVEVLAEKWSFAVKEKGRAFARQICTTDWGRERCSGEEKSRSKTQDNELETREKYYEETYQQEI